MSGVDRKDVPTLRFPSHQTANQRKRLRFEKEEQRRERSPTYKISRSKRYKACSDVVRPVRFERMAFGVGAVLYEVFASQRLLKRRSSPTFRVLFVCFLHLLGLPIFGGSSRVVAAVALAIL